MSVPLIELLEDDSAPLKLFGLTIDRGGATQSVEKNGTEQSLITLPLGFRQNSLRYQVFGTCCVGDTKRSTERSKAVMLQ